jgi:GR25 family glycosyltransferase involved in LPS biosynthesis
MESSNPSDSCAFYCLSYKNVTRKTAMSKRFEQLNINVNFYEGVDFNDPRLICEHGKQCWSCMYGHLDMINKFITETDKEYGIFCEDDIYIHKDLANDIPTLIQSFNEKRLDLLILGALIADGSFLNVGESERRYFSYPDELWGSQMYMISRKHAKTLLDKYYTDYAEKTLNVELNMTPFSADHTLTKDGVRAFIYPMYAVEDGTTIHENESQHNTHQVTFRCNYCPEKFI